MSDGLRAMRRFCRRFDGKRLGPHLAADAHLDWFGRRVIGRRKIESFVRRLGATRHELDAASVRVPSPPVDDVEGDVAPLSGMIAEEPSGATASPGWDSDDDERREAAVALSPVDRGSETDGSPRTPNNPIPREWSPSAEVVNAPRAKRQRRLHLETAEKARQMDGLLGDAVWSEAVGKLYLQRRHDHDDDEVMANVKNFKLRVGATSAAGEASVVGIVYFDNMSCRKKLSFLSQD